MASVAERQLLASEASKSQVYSTAHAQMPSACAASPHVIRPRSERPSSRCTEPVRCRTASRQNFLSRSHAWSAHPSTASSSATSCAAAGPEVPPALRALHNSGCLPPAATGVPVQAAGVAEGAGVATGRRAVMLAATATAEATTATMAARLAPYTALAAAVAATARPLPAPTSAIRRHSRSAGWTDVCFATSRSLAHAGAACRAPASCALSAVARPRTTPQTKRFEMSSLDAKASTSRTARAETRRAAAAWPSSVRAAAEPLRERELEAFGDATSVALEQRRAGGAAGRDRWRGARLAFELAQVASAADVTRAHVGGGERERERQVTELLGDGDARGTLAVVCRLIDAQVVATRTAEQAERAGRRQAAECKNGRAVGRLQVARGDEDVAEAVRPAREVQTEQRALVQ
eukprot:scaffold193596_cov28-Tisochrysis_lutea.AAC.2